MEKEKKVKLIISISIILIIALFISSIILSVFILRKENEIEKQNQEIEKLNNQLEYYKNKTDAKVSMLQELCEVDL